MADSAAAPMEGGKRSAWMSHVKRTMKANKGKSLMQVLKMAKKTYKKSMKGGNAPVDAAPEAPMGETPAAEAEAPKMGGRRRKTRKTKKSRKGGRKH